MFIKNRALFVFCFFLNVIVSLSSLEAAEQDETIMEPRFHLQLQEKARLFNSLHQGEMFLFYRMPGML